MSLYKPENKINKKNKKNNLSNNSNLILINCLPNINKVDTIIMKTFKFIIRLPAIKLTGIKAIRRLK